MSYVRPVMECACYLFEGAPECNYAPLQHAQNRAAHRAAL
jgi:hypothetical protein